MYSHWDGLYLQKSVNHGMGSLQDKVVSEEDSSLMSESSSPGDPFLQIG